MARATWLLGATTLVAASLAVWLYLDNRALRDSPAHRAPPVPAVAAAPAALPAPAPPVIARGVAPVVHAAAGPAPSLPEPPSETETRMDRRARRTEEFAAMFGRL